MTDPTEIMARAIYEDAGMHLATGKAWEVSTSGDAYYCRARAKAALSALEAEGYEVRPKSGAIIRLGRVEAIDLDPTIDGVRLTVVVPDEGWGSQVLIAPLASAPKHGGGNGEA